MAERTHRADTNGGSDDAPGNDEGGRGSVLLYSVGLGLALLLTASSFLIGRTGLLWGPGIPMGLAVLAIAQMGVHLVFFLHLSTGPDHTNNVLALAFGVLISFLVVGGSIWIMSHLNANMVPTRTMLEMQR